LCGKYTLYPHQNVAAEILSWGMEDADPLGSLAAATPRGGF
jgi:hypothetical protein